MTRDLSVQVQKRGTKWQYRIQFTKTNGERDGVSQSGFLTKKEAKRVGDKVAQDMSCNKIIPEAVKEDVTMEEFYAYWLESYCANNLKDSTIHGYKKNLRNMILPYIKDIQLRELNAATLQNLLETLIKKNYALSRVSAVKGMLTGALDYAVRMQFISTNPAHSIRLPNVRKLEVDNPDCLPDVRRPITQNEWNAIISRYPEGTSAHFPLICGYRLGNRLGEAFGYTWDDVDWINHSIHVSRQVLDKPNTDKDGCRWYVTLPKYNSIRDIELDDATYSLLQRIRDKREKYKKWFDEIEFNYPLYYIDENKTIRSVGHKDKVPESWKRMDFINIRNEDGTYCTPAILKNVSRVIHGKANNSGIDSMMGIAIPDFCFHALRHTHGTALIEAGADYKYVSDRLGHKNVETTMNIYIHSTKKIRDRERSTLNNLYSG